jgi:HPt (histidine-containing phosphotransfer) domain-containing protein
MSARVDVDRLAQLGEQEFIDEMVELFSITGAEQIRDVRSAIGHANAGALAKSAHKLKGACLGMFATTMAELADTLEQAGKSARLEHASELLTKLEVAMGETTEQMRTVRTTMARTSSD